MTQSVHLLIEPKESFFDKAWGLLLYSKPKAISFKTRLGIHTFFMRWPIDVLILNEMNIVVELRTMRPFSLWMWGVEQYVVCELPAGSINQYAIEVGTQVVRIHTALSKD